MKNVIDGDYLVWANYFRDWYDDNPDDDKSAPDDPDKTPIAATMKTYFNSSTALDTNTFTLENPNFGAERPMGTTGPATQPNWYLRKQLKVLGRKVTEH